MLKRIHRRRGSLTGSPWVQGRAYCLFSLCMMLSVLFGTSSAYGQTAAEEYQVKAAFLFHFAQLVSWPSGALNAETQSLSLCVFSDEPHRQEIQSTVEGKRVGTRTFRVRTINELRDIRGCNILFMSRDESKQQAVDLNTLRNQPILTVGETDTFLSAGGMIRFRLQDDRVRFDINLGSADAAGLQISSRLLLLATHVIRGPGENHEGY
jgi:hypothetical protein